MLERMRAVRAFSFASVLSLGTIALWLAGCGGGDLGCTGPFCVVPPEQPVAASIQPGEHDGQLGVAQRQLHDSIDVLVTDSVGRPVSGITVNFSVSSGGGSVSSPTAQSNNDGVARVSWTLGPELGPQALQASATNPTGNPLKNSPLALSAVAGLAQPTRMVLLTTLADSARNGVRLLPQPVLQLFDADDQPVAGVAVVASVASGGGTLSGTTTVTSDASGQASFSDLALTGPQGPQTLAFQVISPALQVTANPIQLIGGTPATLSGVEPLAYTGTVSSPVTPGPSVVVKDAAGNPVAGVPVSFTANRNASVSPESTTTNAQGVAQVTWTLGATANISYSLTAQVESSPIAPVRFTATAQPGTAGRLRITTQPSSSTQSGTPFGQQPVIQVVDQDGNPTPQSGVTVTATISSGPSGSLQGATAITDPAGQAAFTGLALTGAVGNYTISFSAPGLTGVTSSPFAITTGGATRLAFVTRPSTAARSRAPLVIQPVLQIQDASGNPIPQAGTIITVSVTAPSTTLSGETATTDANGRAEFTGLSITGIPGPKDLSFSAGGLQSVSARVTLPSVQTVSATPSHPLSAPVASTVAGPVITWILRDGSTRPIADANFTFTLPSGGTAATLTPLSDANGAVQVGDWTLSPTAGYQYLELRLPDNRVFRDSILTTPGPANDLVKFSGDSQSAPINSVLAQNLVVRVVDQYGNGISNVTVQWATCDGVPGDPVPPTDGGGFSSIQQPTGSQSSGDQFFCTRASADIGGATKTVDFHYQVTGASTQGGELTGP